MEMVVTLALAATILALAIPNFTNFQRNARLTSASNEFLSSVLGARSEALKRQASVAICASADPTAADPTCTAGPFSGWITFVDTNNDCLRDVGEAVVRAQPTLPSTVRNDADGDCVSFAASGFRQPIAGTTSLAHAVFCDARGNVELPAGSGQSAARGIDVLPTGRTRITRAHAEIASWNGTFGVACP